MKNKVLSITRITIAEFLSTASLWILIVPLLFVLIASILETEFVEKSGMYIRMSLISLCIILMMVQKNLLIGNGIMRKNTLPMTHNEKFVALMLTSLITIAAWIFYFAITGAVILAIVGTSIFDMSIADTLLDFTLAFFTGKMLIYFWYMAMLTLLSISFAMNKRKRKQIFAELITMVILLFTIVISGDFYSVKWMYTPYIIISIIICIAESYRNIKNIESF